MGYVRSDHVSFSEITVSDAVASILVSYSCSGSASLPSLMTPVKEIELSYHKQPYGDV